ncbi:MAG: transglycosylase domain-containing protein [Bacteroidetes bacterium]|nr:transglycosylase domain-containing protein [Bacteroidota bacterium]
MLVNRLPIHTGFEISKNKITLVNLKVRIPEVDANTFFTSLPSGLFSTLEGINASGQLKYRLDFSLNPDAPDSLLFDSELKGNNFRVTKFGNENFAAINGQFIYVAQDKDRILSVFPVGPENPDFIPLTEISPLLTNSVLTAEDGTFRFHRGFNEEAFRQSIATNIKERRFARGGSTITMQLVKNVFLNRNKTVSRKLEEAIIVWMIESTGMVSKDRMLEVYLNIIEWGPGIFGIGEASQFYFSKHPSQLTLEESIFLSSIIPNPKAFRYSFDKQGMLREYLQYYFKLVAGRLARKEIITQEQLDQLKFGVELKGPALQYVVPTDTIPADTIPTEFEPLFFENL